VPYYILFITSSFRSNNSINFPRSLKMRKLLVTKIGKEIMARSQCPPGLRHQLSPQLKHCGSGFESHSRHGCSRLFSVCVVYGGLIPRPSSPTDCLYDQENVKQEPRFLITAAPTDCLLFVTVKIKLFGGPHAERTVTFKQEETWARHQDRQTDRQTD
jgi:hypothetical protein